MEVKIANNDSNAGGTCRPHELTHRRSDSD